MGRSNRDSEAFCEVLTALAEDPAGWHSVAGSEFVELMRSVLERKICALKSRSRGASLMVDASDAVSEAILIVEGPSQLTLSQNVARILAMEKPLGYVISAVSANLNRAELSGQMGTGSSQIVSGSLRVLHFDELRRPSEQDPLDVLVAEPAWARGEQRESSKEARKVAASFIAVLAQRFRVRPEVSGRGLEIAGSAALMGDSGAGLTPATTRRRVGLFMRELPALRGAFDRVQARAFAALLFGSERHPEWSLLAECGRAVREATVVSVSPWHAQNARIVAARSGRASSELRQQPALFPDPLAQSRTVRMTA